MSAFNAFKKSFNNLWTDNYSTWSKNMKALLKTCCIWLTTSGRYREPDYDWQDWQETLGVAASIIYLCLESSQNAHMEDFHSKGDPEGMWDKPKVTHQQQKPIMRFTTYDSFFSIQKEDAKSLTDLYSCVTRSMTEIQNLHPAHFGLSQLNEELQCMALIHALPCPEYNNFITLLFFLSEKLTLDGI
ncbi:hypothetical protein ARMGADRAFT_930957 [Armillaria gallica]|uniref:DUF4219 domain-containing protein n=1 Tax=Armillaria gallica TaxID=47427 RepID=A0A2H3DAR8_ARMGA|nr:hypothetical protein ARMGADRAFT_930957 [Armillaria gallica]